MILLKCAPCILLPIIVSKTLGHILTTTSYRPHHAPPLDPDASQTRLDICRQDCPVTVSSNILCMTSDTISNSWKGHCQIAYTAAKHPFVVAALRCAAQITHMLASFLQLHGADTSICAVQSTTSKLHSIRACMACSNRMTFCTWPTCLRVR